VFAGDVTGPVDKRYIAAHFYTGGKTPRGSIPLSPTTRQVVQRLAFIFYNEKLPSEDGDLINPSISGVFL